MLAKEMAAITIWALTLNVDCCKHWVGFTLSFPTYELLVTGFLLIALWVGPTGESL